MVDYQEAYKRKCVTADEAVKIIQSGDMVAIPIDTPAQSLLSALIRRKDELEDVKIVLRNPRVDLGWLQDDHRPSIPGWLAFRIGSTPVIVIEHVVQSLVKIADLMIGLDEGRKVADGTPGEVISNPHIIEAYLGAKWRERCAKS